MGLGAGGVVVGGAGRLIEVKEDSERARPAQGVTEVSERRMEEGPG